MRVLALSARGKVRIVARPVNESETPRVPAPLNDAPPTPPMPAASEGAARQHSASLNPSESGAPSESGSEPSGSEPSGSGPLGEGAEGGGQGPGEGERRRRRRRRRGRRRGEGAGPGGPGAEGAEGSEGSEGPEGSESAGAESPEGGEGAAAAGETKAEGAAGNAGPRPERRPRPDRSREGSDRPREERRGRQDRPKGQERNQGRRERPQHDRNRNERPERRRDSAHLAMIATEALAEMAQQLLRIEGVDPLAMPRYLELNLRVPLDGGNDIRHAAGTATEQILQRVREVREHERALRPGAVYSYFAGSSHAEGCRPTEPRQVFDGYTSTGRPIFTDFVTMSIERKDPNIDRLLAGEELVLTRVTMGRVLRTQQLAEFGGNSPVFKILGQVDAGLFKVLGAAGKCAFSFQLLRGTTLEGRIRLRLHAVGAVDPMELADPALMQILSRCQRHLDTEALRLQGQSQQGEVDEEAFVLPLLNELARQLQNRTRHAGRRTQHGLERSEEGQRPTSRAYPDAGEASDDAILWDLDQNTIVVLGGKGRVHVFTQQAKHITSVMMQGSAIERRRHMGRWRLAEPEERGEFRIHCKRLIASGQDATEEDVLPQAVAKASVADAPAGGAADSNKPSAE